MQCHEYNFPELMRRTMLIEAAYPFHQDQPRLKFRLSGSAPCACLPEHTQLQHPVGMFSAGSVLLIGAIRSQNVPCVDPLLPSLLLYVCPMRTSDRAGMPAQVTQCVT